MSAYYNELDPFKAEVLREAIKARVIAPGDVDERSIADVRPAELVGYTQCHFFAGGGFWSVALRNAGWADDRPVWTGSCPCPSFSAAGKGQGFADPRHLWPEWFRLIRECAPPVIFGEQVAAAIGYGWLDLVSGDLEEEGYAVGSLVLGAHSVGAPHIRQRLYFVADTECGAAESQRFDMGREALAPEGRGQERERIRLDTRTGKHAGELVQPIGTGLEGHAGDGCREECSDDGGERARDGAQGWAAGSEPSGDSDLVARIDGGAAGPWRSYAEWFGVCWNPACQSREERGCICTTLGSPAGWKWDADEGWVNAGGMVDAAGERCGEARQSIGGRAERISQSRDSFRPSPLNGFWRDADWIGCRDGKWRPVESGTFPLAHGSTARVGRLRMYGDGIVVPLAAEFVKAAKEIIDSAEFLCGRTGE